MPSRGYRQTLARLLLLCAVAMPAAGADVYRVELLLFERLFGEPELLPERYNPNPIPDSGVPLWVSSDWSAAPPSDTNTMPEAEGPVERTPKVDALPHSQLRLNNIANALDNDSGYRVLAFTGWQNPFPDGYRTVPLVVDVASTDDSGQRIQGSLQIERRRYLHVEASLFDTHLREPTLDVAPIPRVPIASGPATPLPDYLAPESPAFRETATWLRQNRRMRSEEVHYMDAPTFGLIVYFHPITQDAGEAEDGN